MKLLKNGRYRCSTTVPATSIAELSVRRASPEEARHVHQILDEAARWLERYHRPLWIQGEVEFSRIERELRYGACYILARVHDELAGTVKYLTEDNVFWPDVPPGEAAYIHHLAVRRKFAGGAVSGALLRKAADLAREANRMLLRLDCDAGSYRLRQTYEHFGFRFHSAMELGPYSLARYEMPLCKRHDIVSSRS